MGQKQLLRFIKDKAHNEGDGVVYKEKDGSILTLREVFKKLNISIYAFDIDMLDCHADRSTFQRFDKFNAKYNPLGQSELRDIFLKTDNFVGGKYFADLVKVLLKFFLIHTPSSSYNRF